MASTTTRRRATTRPRRSSPGTVRLRCSRRVSRDVFLRGGDMDESGASGKGRRRFLKSVGALSASVPAAALGQQHSHGAAQGEKYMFLSAAEVAFLDAAVARLIPADELSPGAKEAGVTYFIDQQLVGGFGTMARMYRQGPHPEGTPQQGYQSPLTPQEVYRAAIRELTHMLGRPFEKFSASE